SIPMTDPVQRFPSLSHWGAFTAVVQDGRLIDCEPFAFDAAPSAILKSMPDSIHSSLRVARPAVRESWLRRRGPRHASGHPDVAGHGHDRGREPFVEVTWDVALKLVADELARVRSDYGGEAIFGGSYGW